MEWLIGTQVVTLCFLILSELLGISTTDANGILDALYKLYKDGRRNESTLGV